MINRAKMPRQLRNKGGIMTIGGGGYTGIPMGSRTGFGTFRIDYQPDGRR